MVGSTTLSQRLDPEDISAVMDDALARETTIVQAHRGKVLQSAGDNILTVFGADLASEDDAERAVRCGHAGFNVRVGLHTGGVLLGGGVDVALVEGDLVAAQAALQPLLDHVDAGGTLDGADDQRQLELSTHHVPQRAGDRRAEDWLVRAHTALMAQAEAIERSGGASMRQGYLQNIPAHREIVALWARRTAAGDAPTKALD